MNRLLIASAIAAAACAVATPAVAGLAGNPSFSHRLPVQVPTQARLVQFDDSGHITGSEDPTATPTTTGSAHHNEPGDDHGGATNSREPEPGDDRGDDRTPGEAEPGDDRGLDDSPLAGATTEPGDDHSRGTGTGSGHGGSGGSGGR